MKRAHALPIAGLSFAVMALLLGCGMTQPAMQQQEQKSLDAASSGDFNYLNRGIVDDWTTHHVVFSNPGTLEDAIRNGKREEWERIVADPRYRMQWVKRYGPSTSLLSDDQPILQAPSQVELPAWVFEKRWRKKRGGFRSASIHADWSVSLGGGADAQDTYPAKYTFAPIGTPSCTNDFVVFGINTNGKSNNQADLVGVNNLYASPTCSGTVPTVLFAYFVGTGIVQTSPVLSEDGTKVAFVETITGGSKFHVLTLDKSGNSGCSSSTTPCNGNFGNAPATPGIHNSAVDTAITMSGSVTDSNSGPFVDYQNDIAYVGDDTGHLHKFTPVFQGIPAEVTTGNWPVAVSTGALTGPVYDSVSTNIFVGSALGNLRCITSSGALCAVNLIGVAGGTQNEVVDAPIVDSTNGTVFATASNATTSVLLQATTSLGNVVRVNMGASGTDLYDGAFDNAYFTSVGTGHIYFCGNLTTAATPTLLRVGFNSSGTMNSSNDGNSFELVTANSSGKGDDCTPITEVFNTSQSADYLFVGVSNHGFNTSTPGCGDSACLIGFVITSSFPAAANAVLTPQSGLGRFGMSGIIIDNVAGTAGASQIYFGNLQASTGVQASQSALK